MISAIILGDGETKMLNSACTFLKACSDKIHDADVMMAKILASQHTFEDYYPVHLS